MPVKVLHVITGLGVGGAEKMLYKLLKVVDKTQFETRVVSLREGGAIADDIRALGIPVESLQMSGLLSAFSGVLALRKIVDRWRPDLVQSWMYHANLVASAALRDRKIPLIWGVRYSIRDLRSLKPMTRLIIRWGCFFSKRPARILYNAESIADQHEAIGYAAERRAVIPNGIDVEDVEAVSPGALRAHLGLAKDVPVIGMVARFDPQKDFDTFLDAAEQLRASSPAVRYVLIGPGVHAGQAALDQAIERRRLSSAVHLLGEKNDPRPFVRDFDVFTLSSKNGEAFPNVVIEAMALGVPVVATDVGDTAAIMGDAGMVVPPRDPNALAKAWRAILSMSPEERKKFGAAAQTRVRARYNLRNVVAAYAQLYRDVLQ